MLLCFKKENHTTINLHFILTVLDIVMSEKHFSSRRYKNYDVTKPVMSAVTISPSGIDRGN